MLTWGKTKIFKYIKIKPFYFQTFLLLLFWVMPYMKANLLVSQFNIILTEDLS